MLVAFLIIPPKTASNFSGISLGVSFFCSFGILLAVKQGNRIVSFYSRPKTISYK